MNGGDDRAKAVTLETVWGIIFEEDNSTIMNDLHYRETRFNIS